MSEPQENRKKNMQKALKLLFPGASLWDDKFSGSDLADTLDGYAVQFARAVESSLTVQNMYIPQKTTFLDELDFIFFQSNDGLTEDERRGRFDARMRMLIQSKNRRQLMELVLHASGFSGAVVRTLGWYGTNESPYDFFPDTGFAFYGAEDAIYNDDNAIFGNTEVFGNAFLITNGGTIEWAVPPEEAPIQLEQNPDFWGNYLVVEAAANQKLEVAERLQKTLFDLLYILKPGDFHIILNAEFTE